MPKSPAGQAKPRTPGPTLTPDQLSAIHDGLTKAGLVGHRIASMHLVPTADSGGVAAAAGVCHSEQLPDGSWTIVC